MPRTSDIVIPAAGMGRRMKSFGPKGLIQLRDGETVIARQVRLLSVAFPKAHIVVVAGFEAERIRRALPKNVRVVINPDYEETNVARSIAHGMNYTTSSSVVIVYGDLVFNDKTLAALDSGKSSVVVDRTGTRKEEVGVNVVDGMVTHFDYFSPVKWGQIAVLATKEQKLFKQLAKEQHRRRQFGFEIMNEVLKRDGEFIAVEPPGMELVEIDCSKDIEPARKVAQCY